MVFDNGTSLKYNVKDLILVLQENRGKHEENFHMAMKLYKQEVVKVLEVKLAEAREGKTVSHGIPLSVPVEYLKDYDRAIKMYELTSQDTVILDQNTFGQLIMDEWSWKHTFDSNTVAYVAAATDGETVYTSAL